MITLTRLLLFAAPFLPAGLDLPDSSNVAVVRALETIRSEEIRSDIFFIASDAMAGRDTPSPEQRIMARFIRARLQRLGFQPGNGDKFLYEYPLAKTALDPASLVAELTQGEHLTKLSYGTDYIFTNSFGTRLSDQEGAVVYCGFGEREDFRDVDLKGAWALCSYADENVYRIRSRARKAGAIGLLLVPSNGADLVALFDKADDAAFAGRVTWPQGSSGSNRNVFPICALGQEVSALLLGEGERSIGEQLEGTFRESRGLVGSGKVMAENVVGFWPGSDIDLMDEVLIVSAHFDHVGVRGGQIYNGADDNGSGTSGLLALAEALKSYGPMKRSVMLIWVSGEEKGLWGSKAWALNPSLPEGTRAVADINMDMIGRNAPNVLYVTPSSKHEGYNGLTRLAEQFGLEEGFGDFPEGIRQGFDGLGSADKYYMRSDHAEFAKLDIPICFLFAGEHEDYHQDSDTPDKIDYDKIRRVTRVVLRMLDSLQSKDMPL